MKTIEQPEDYIDITIDLQDKEERLTLRWLQLGTDRENIDSPTNTVHFYEDGRTVGTNGFHAHVVPRFKGLSGKTLLINKGKLLLKGKDTKTLATPSKINMQPDIDLVYPKLEPIATIAVPIQQLREALEMPTNSLHIRLEIYGNLVPLIVRDIEEKGRYALISPVHLPA